MSRRQAIVLFLAAVLVRLSYVGLVLWLDGSFDNGSDSGKYLIRAANILEYGELVYLDYGVLIPDAARMPLYPYFLAAVLGIAGREALWAVAVVQSFVDAATVFAVAFIAKAIDDRWTAPAGVLACVWTTLVVYSSFVLTDTLFLAFFSGGLAATVWAVRSERKLPLLVAAGVLYGLALLTRPVLLFFPYVLAPALAYLLWRTARLRPGRAVALAAVPATLLALALVPRLAMTYAHYGVPVVTTQAGNQALDVVDQLLRNCPSCGPEREAKMHETVGSRLAERTEEERRNPVVLDRIRREVAFENLLAIPPWVAGKGVLGGAARSTLQTGLYEAGYQLNQNPTFFSAVPGPTLLARLGTFAAGIATDGFMFAWAFAQTATLLAFALQVVGGWRLLRDAHARPFTLFLLVVAAYFLALNGPFGNPRYGMPLTPTLIVLTVAGGWSVLFRWRRVGQGPRGRPPAQPRTRVAHGP